MTTPVELAGLLACGVAGGLLGLSLRVPLGGLLGSVTAAGGFHLLAGGTATLGRPTQLAAQLVVGAVVGGSLHPQVLRTLREVAGRALAICAVLVVAALGLAWAVMGGLGSVDPLTGFLSAAPAGATEMGTASLSVGADTEVVVTTHVLRIVTVSVLGATVLPALVRRLRRRPP